MSLTLALAPYQAEANLASVDLPSLWSVINVTALRAFHQVPGLIPAPGWVSRTSKAASAVLPTLLPVPWFLNSSCKKALTLSSVYLLDPKNSAYSLNSWSLSLATNTACLATSGSKAVLWENLTSTLEAASKEAVKVLLHTTLMLVVLTWTLAPCKCGLQNKR